MRGQILIGILIGGVVGGWAAEGVEPGSAPVASLSGLSGTIRVPSAELMPYSSIRATWNALPDVESPAVAGTNAFVVTTPLLPRTEAALAMGPQKFGSDLTINAKWQLRAPTPARPGWALGVLDIKRTGQWDAPTAFLVATQRVADGRGALTAGVAAGQNSGLLLGATWALTPWLEMQAEYDSARVNIGALTRLGRHLQLRVAETDVGTTIATTYEFGLADARPLPAIPGLATISGQSVPQALVTIQTALVAEGFEDVELWQEATRVGVAYENRRYTRSELDGILAVLTILAHTAPDETTTFILHTRKRRLAVAQITVDAAATRQFAAGTLPVEALAHRWRVETFPGTAPAVPANALPRANSSAGHTDLAFGMKTTSTIGSENGTQVGLFVAPQLTIPLGRGLVAEGLWLTPVAGQLVEDEPGLSTERALVAYAFQPLPHSLAQVSVGRFSRQEEGIALEVVRPVGANQLYRAVGAWLETEAAGERPYALAEYGYWLSQYHTYLRVVGGQFIHDRGVGGDITRFFGDIQVRVGLRHTTKNSLAELQLTIPMGPSRQPQRPTGLRVRVADDWTFRARSVLKGANYFSRSRFTAVELPLGPSVSEAFLDANRLLPGPMAQAWTSATP
jgi:hypothetical protein